VTGDGSKGKFIKIFSLFAICAVVACVGCGKGSIYGDFGSPVFSAQGDGFRVLVNDRGAMAIDVNGDLYTIESSYSYPGPGGKIGTNELPRRQQVNTWQLDIQTEKAVPEQVRIIGKGKYYTLIRTISVEGYRIGISDEIVNETNEDMGVIIQHRVVTTGEPREILFGGAPWETGKGIIGAGKDLVKRIMLRLGRLTSKVGYQAENPTLFVSLKRSNLGIIAEDTFSRLQFEGYRYRAAFSLEHFALRPHVSHTLKWAIYPLDQKADYFTFVNKVRRDWKTNFTISGPWDFFNCIDHQEKLEHPAQLAEFLKQKGIQYQVVTFTPWLDYDNFNWRTGKTVAREEYKKLIQSGLKAFKTVEPGIKCLGSIQSCWRSLPKDVMIKLYEKIPPEQRKQGFYRFTDEQMKVVQDLPLAWKESFVKGPHGRYIYELAYGGPPQNEPLMAISVYEAIGNSQFAYLMDQAKFIMEDVGLDGIYIDNFSLAFKADPSQRYTYDRWDGITVDIDPHTGKILRRYTDCAWSGIEAKESLFQYIHSRGGIVVANTAAATQELQSLPIMRFIEGSGVMDHFDFVAGQEPPLSRFLCRGQLGSPIALGWSAYVAGVKEGGPEYSRKVMATAITYLRHGLLYYYYGHYDYGVQSSKTGEYGAINHMFPITPTDIGEGFVAGKERIVTSVSGKFSWNMDRKPSVLCFDMENRPKKASFSLQKDAQGWNVTLDMNDWQEICIVE
jgi:hypothetical protein